MEWPQCRTQHSKKDKARKVPHRFLCLTLKPFHVYCKSSPYTVVKKRMGDQSIHQIVSQYENLLTKKIFKFHSNLMQRFRVDLKTFLDLAMPIQCCPAVTKQIFSWYFGWDFRGGNPKPSWSCILYYHTICYSFKINITIFNFALHKVFVYNLYQRYFALMYPPCYTKHNFKPCMYANSLHAVPCSVTFV